MTFFFQIYLKLCCSKRKEPPLKCGIDLWEEDLWEEMMRRFDSRGLLLYPRAKKFDAPVLTVAVYFFIQEPKSLMFL